MNRTDLTVRPEGSQGHAWTRTLGTVTREATEDWGWHIECTTFTHEEPQTPGH